MYLVEERKGVNLLNDETEGSEHSNATVLELSLTQNADIENLGKPKRIKANVTRERAIEVGRLLKERHGLRERAREDSHARGGDRC